MRFLLIIPSLLVLSGCDFAYGVRRSAVLDVEPTLTCVEEVLRSTPGITTVEYKRQEGGRPLTLTGLGPPTVNHAFLFSGPDHVKGVLQYQREANGDVAFWQSNMGLNSVPPQEEVTATRPVMRRIEVSLAQRCQLHDLPSKVTEWCAKEECPVLP